MTNRVLIAGNAGMLGKDIANVFKKEGAFIIGLDLKEYSGNDVDAHYLVDLCDEKKVLKILEIEQPDLIIYTAAIINFELCESNKELADCVHAKTPALIAKNKRIDSKLIYISTDSVFDGLKGNYTENDPPNPLNYYSFSKLKGEKLVLQNKNCLVIRTNIFGFNIPLKQSLAEWAIANLHREKKIIGFDDVIFNAIYTFDLATIIQKISGKDFEGIINIGCKGAWSKYDFIKNLAKSLGYKEKLIEKGNSGSIRFKIKRPLKTNLDTKKIESITTIPSLEESVRNICQKLKKHNYEIWRH